MLKHPGTDIDFVVDPLYFVACFDIYDREEDLGKYLATFNPNDASQLQRLFRERLGVGPAFLRYATEHKLAILKVLEKALSTSNTDFGSILAPENLSASGIFLPDNWVFTHPRNFFFEAYVYLYGLWADSLEADGKSLVPPELLKRCN